LKRKEPEKFVKELFGKKAKKSQADGAEK